MSLNSKVRKLRDKLGVTQVQLAKMSGITPATVSRIESGQIRELKSEALRRLARALGVSVEYLIGPNKERKRLARMDNPDLEFIAKEYEKLSYKGREQMKHYISFLVETERKQGKSKE